MAWTQYFCWRSFPGGPHFRVSSQKTLVFLTGREAFLCFGFGFDFLDVSQGEPDAAAKVVGFEFPGSPPSTKCHRSDLPSQGQILGSQERCGCVVFCFHLTSHVPSEGGFALMGSSKLLPGKCVFFDCRTHSSHPFVSALLSWVDFPPTQNAEVSLCAQLGFPQGIALSKLERPAL